MKVIFILFIVQFFFIGCIPIKNVATIDGYKIIAGNAKSKNDHKYYSKFKVSNQGNYSIMAKFLKTKFDDVFEFKGKIYVNSKIVKITDNIQELVFSFSKDQEKYISPLNGLQRKELPKYDRGYGVEGESIFKDGKAYFFMEVIVRDETKNDYLSSKSIWRNEVIEYLQMIMLEYNNFQKAYIRINE